MSIESEAFDYDELLVIDSHGQTIDRLRDADTEIAGLKAALQQQGEPIGWVFQQDETGRTTFCPNDGVNTAETFAEINPRYSLVSAAYTHPPKPVDVANCVWISLADELNNMEASSHLGSLHAAGVVAGLRSAADRIHALLALGVKS